MAELMRPTARAISWHPPVWASLLAVVYVAAEARTGYIDYRITVLRLAALLICMAAAFVFDDPTEETIGHVPTPLLMRRGLRIALLLPLVSTAWVVLVKVAGEVPRLHGGPLPVADITLEVATLFMTALCASCLGARFTSDRLGGIVAAPVLLGLAALAMVLPGEQRMIVGSGDPRWADVHEWWRAGLALSILCFFLLNRSTGSPSPSTRVRASRRTPRTA